MKDAEAVVKYLQEGGAKKFGATASCWGAWALFTCCAHQLPLSACVSYHPALGLAAVFGSTAVELASKVSWQYVFNCYISGLFLRLTFLLIRVRLEELPQALLMCSVHFKFSQI